MNQKDLVKRLQSALNELGENLTVDGDLGPMTEAALSKYTLTMKL
jgi:peptidoglycan hydrolase-like protein with peptidoglycan-binding domain